MPGGPWTNGGHGCGDGMPPPAWGDGAAAGGSPLDGMAPMGDPMGGVPPMGIYDPMGDAMGGPKMIRWAVTQWAVLQWAVSLMEQWLLWIPRPPQIWLKAWKLLIQPAADAADAAAADAPADDAPTDDVV